MSEGQIAEFIKNDEVLSRQLIGETALPPVAALGLEPIDQIDHVIKSATGAGADAASGDGDGQMCLAGTRPANQHDVALLGVEATAGELVHERLIDLRALELEVVEVLGKRSFAMVSWYLIERACFSLISALSKSPTMR